MFAVGLAQGPAHHYWYTKLDKLLPRRNLRAVGLKILADQLVAAPFFAFTFIVGMGLLADNKLSVCLDEFVKKFPTLYMVCNASLSLSQKMASVSIFLVRLVHLAAVAVSQLCPDSSGLPGALCERGDRRLGRHPFLDQALRKMRDYNFTI